MRNELILATALIACSACGGTRDDEMMDRAALEKFAIDYTAAWNSGIPENVASFYAQDGSLAINGGEPSVGRAALADVARSFMDGFPDMVLEFDGLKFTDGRVNYHWTFRGRHTGPGGTGSAVDFSGYESWLFNEEGLVSESLGNFDAEDYERQLAAGAVNE
jgi:hypothetical protein